MMVHAGAGATDDARNRGTLVNALLHHFKTLSGGRRRAASGDRASPGSRDQRADGGGEERRGAPAAGQAVQQPRGAQDLHCAGAWLAEAGSRYDPERDQPPLAEAHAHDDARLRWPRCGDTLRGAAKNRFALRQVCAAWNSRSRRDAPTRFACICRRLGIRWWATRSMARPANCGRNRINGGRRACPRLSLWIGIFCIRPRSSSASADQGVAEVLAAVTDGTGEPAREPGECSAGRAANGPSVSQKFAVEMSDFSAIVRHNRSE